MLLTKECDYGLRIMRSLSDGEKKTMQTVCNLEYIPQKYAYKIMKKLQKAGLVQNKRGPDGGYFLLKPLNSFSIYDVVTAVDERLFLFECLRDEKQCLHNNGDHLCKIHTELARIQKLLMEEMKVKSIDEILDDEKES